MEEDPLMTKVQCWPGLTALRPMKRPSRYRCVLSESKVKFHICVPCGRKEKRHHSSSLQKADEIIAADSVALLLVSVGFV